MNWLIFGTYILGWVLSARWHARAVLNNWDNDPVSGVRIDSVDRWGALVLGIIWGLLWPIIIPIYVLGKATGPDRWLRSDREIQEAEHAELEHLRALAKRYNLPMGD